MIIFIIDIFILLNEFVKYTIDVSIGNSATCFKLKQLESSAAIDISIFSGNSQIEHFIETLLIEFTIFYFQLYYNG
jgi:hypothetical protein